MNIQTQHAHDISAIVRLGASRQVAIPKRIWHALNLKSGEYMEIKRQGKALILSPKKLVDKFYGPFTTVDDMFDVLDRKKKL